MKFKDFIILLGLILVIIGFIRLGINYSSEYVAKPVKVEKSKYQGYFKMCLQGVAYWRRYDKMAPVYNKYGSLELCEDK